MTLRCRVLAVIQDSDTTLTGAEIAQLSGVSYRQTIFALNALYNGGKIARKGRKFTARWGAIHPPDQQAVKLLEQAFAKFTGLRR